MKTSLQFGRPVADGFVGEELIPQGRPSALITSVADRFLLREREAIMYYL